MVRVVHLLFAVSLTACIAPIGDECAEDVDCGSGYACARTGECVLPDALISVRLSWTFTGIAPDDSLCDDLGVTSMRVSFTDRAGDRLSYEPVVCGLGQVYYNRMPDRFESVSIAALSGARIRDSARFSLQGVETTVTADLTP